MLVSIMKMKILTIIKRLNQKKKKKDSYHVTENRGRGPNKTKLANAHFNGGPAHISADITRPGGGKTPKESTREEIDPHTSTYRIVSWFSVRTYTRRRQIRDTGEKKLFTHARAMTVRQSRYES